MTWDERPTEFDVEAGTGRAVWRQRLSQNEMVDDQRLFAFDMGIVGIKRAFQPYFLADGEQHLHRTVETFHLLHSWQWRPAPGLWPACRRPPESYCPCSVWCRCPRRPRCRCPEPRCPGEKTNKNGFLSGFPCTLAKMFHPLDPRLSPTSWRSCRMPSSSSSYSINSQKSRSLWLSEPHCTYLMKRFSRVSIPPPYKIQP